MQGASSSDEEFSEVYMESHPHRRHDSGTSDEEAGYDSRSDADDPRPKHDGPFRDDGPKRDAAGREEDRREFDIDHPLDATRDCFDEVDGHPIEEPEEVKERRLAGKSGLRDQLAAFDSRAVFYSSLFLFESLCFLASPPLFLAYLLVVVAPVALFYYWWLMNQKEASLPMIIHALGRGFYDVTLMMICASYGALMTGLVILFWFYDAGAFKSSHSDNAATFTFYVFVIVPFVVSEESLKALFVRQQQRRLARRSFESNAAAAIKNGDSDRVETGNRRRHRSSSSSSKSRDGHGSEASPAAAGNTMTRTHLVLSTATSVGYALSQAMGWVVVTHLALKQYHAGYQSNLAQQFGWMLLTGILVTAFGTPLQLLSGYLIGLEVTRDAWHWWSYALLVPALLRSAYYISGAGLLILLDGVFGALALWFLVNLGLCYALASRVQAVEAAMPAEYLTNVGYLRWGVAYGQLNAHDDDGDDGSGIQAGVQDAESLPSQRRQTRSNQQQLQHPREKAESSQGVVEMRTHTSSHRNSAACSGGSSGGGGIPASAATPAAASPPAAAAAAPKPVATRDSVMARLNAMKAAKAKGKTNASSPPSTADADATATMLSSRAAATTQHLSLPPGTSDSSSKSNSASSGGSGSRSGEVHNPIAASPGQFEYDNDGDEIAVL